MPIALTNVIVRHERRIRVLFSVNLTAGAFAPGPYAITVDEGEVPLVLDAYVVQNSPAVVELAFDRDLSPYTTYSIAALSILGTDGSSTNAIPDGSNTAPFQLALTPTPADVENPDDDLGALVYGEDLAWDGTDFAETDQGDLAGIAGLANYQGAIQRRVATDITLPWAPTYNENPGHDVNGPSPLAPTLAGDAQRQALADDRTKSATLIFGVAASDPSTTQISLVVVPISAATGKPIAIPLLTL